MNKMKTISTFILATLCSLHSYAGPKLYDTKYNGVRVYDRLVSQGVPKAALERVFEFLDVNGGKTVKVKAKVRAKRTYMGERKVKVKNRYAGIIDFTQASDKKRLFVMDLKTGAVVKYHVAHGRGSGVTVPAKFSNVDGSKMSSLGLYLAGDTYRGKHGESMNLYGLDKSNSLAASRDIVMHSAVYATERYAKALGRLGRSWGCPAVAPEIIKKMISTFNEGGVLFAYHKDFAATVTKNPVIQEVKVDKDQDDIDLPGEEESLSKDANPKSVDDLEAMVRDRIKNLEQVPVPAFKPSDSEAEQEEESEVSFEGLTIPVPSPRPEIESEASDSIEKIIEADQQTTTTKGA